ncbi:hypothetical protein WL94_00060 [Burkholderia cepacia]|nr:hypothetical protein WL94_00060 [Burkholderia cepacia]
MSPLMYVFMTLSDAAAGRAPQSCRDRREGNDALQRVRGACRMAAFEADRTPRSVPTVVRRGTMRTGSSRPALRAKPVDVE